LVFCAILREMRGSDTVWLPAGRGLNQGEAGMLKQFREFAMKGNVVDLAVGVIIGAAFGNIVSSLVADIFMPVIGSVTGGLDFSNYFVALSKSVTADNLEEARRQGAVLAYGRFLTLFINFLIVAFILFFIVRGINSLKREEAKKPDPAPPRSELLLQEIRDLLAKEVRAHDALTKDALAKERQDLTGGRPATEL